MKRGSFALLVITLLLAVGCAGSKGNLFSRTRITTMPVQVYENGDIVVLKNHPAVSGHPTRISWFAGPQVSVDWEETPSAYIYRSDHKLVAGEEAIFAIFMGGWWGSGWIPDSAVRCGMMQRNVPINDDGERAIDNNVGGHNGVVKIRKGSYVEPANAPVDNSGLKSKAESPVQAKPADEPKSNKIKSPFKSNETRPQSPFRN